MENEPEDLNEDQVIEEELGDKPVESEDTEVKPNPDTSDQEINAEDSTPEN